MRDFSHFLRAIFPFARLAVGAHELQIIDNEQINGGAAMQASDLAHEGGERDCARIVDEQPPR